MAPAGVTDRRMIDYVSPDTKAYTRFLKKEQMVPLIESGYRTNGERTFYGVSAGGALGVDMLSNEPVGTSFFKRYVPGGAALNLLDQQVVDERRRASRPAPSCL